MHLLPKPKRYCVLSSKDKSTPPTRHPVPHLQAIIQTLGLQERCIGCRLCGAHFAVCMRHYRLTPRYPTVSSALLPSVDFHNRLTPYSVCQLALCHIEDACAQVTWVSPWACGPLGTLPAKALSLDLSSLCALPLRPWQLDVHSVYAVMLCECRDGGPGSQLLSCAPSILSHRCLCS